eukprot:scaffold7657_cov109-Isochrysis_galbana.AAC.8
MTVGTLIDAPWFRARAGARARSKGNGYARGRGSRLARGGWRVGSSELDRHVSGRREPFQLRLHRVEHLIPRRIYLGQLVAHVAGQGVLVGLSMFLRGRCAVGMRDGRQVCRSRDV